MPVRKEKKNSEFKIIYGGPSLTIPPRVDLHYVVPKNSSEYQCFTSIKDISTGVRAVAVTRRVPAMVGGGALMV